MAGWLIAEVSKKGRLTGDYVHYWLGTHVDSERRGELFCRVMDPAVRFYIPILALAGNGWWIQIARRLFWVTGETEDEVGLFELLLNDTTADGQVSPLAGVEAILIAVPLRRQMLMRSTADVQQLRQHPGALLVR